MMKAYQTHLTSANDLVTTYQAQRAGFISLALEKNRRATPFVEEARTLQVAASQAKTPTDLLDIPLIQSALLTAAGLSDKALRHLQPGDKKEAILGLIEQFLAPAGEKFVEELVYRFLLTRGDTLGGAMRNVAGLLAEQKVTRSVVASLTLAEKPFPWFHAPSKQWLDTPENLADIEQGIKGLSWRFESEPRTLLYNTKVSWIGNNIDLVLLRTSPKDLVSDSITPENYVALGELKGGIDPAGADEHWKTARSALNRIRRRFVSQPTPPATFFVGAAIESKMAQEIWEELEQGTLANAANLTNPSQLSSLTLWLTRL